MPDHISAPLPDAEIVTGEPFNALRQDLFYNHAHRGGGDGSQISHADLLDGGDRTHAEIDSALTVVEGRISLKVAIADRFDDVTRTSGPGWSAYLGEYNGSEGFIVTVNFSPALASVPIVTVTPRPGDYDSHGNEGIDFVSIHTNYVYDESVDGFKMLTFRDYWGSDGVVSFQIPRPVRFNFIVVSA